MPRYMAAPITRRQPPACPERTPKWELNDEASTGSPMLPSVPREPSSPGPIDRLARST
ncbi:UNVERIFIED_CONTAM: hypothetical protein Sradi_0708700 [Sesamum radiatum]|uniref:Uncharacterized protein n=1 Tax=Sesamum radiatum TaxID=300843 RepID=A0AAW2VMU7_SESRA